MNNNALASSYFILFCTVTHFFVLNVIVAVFVEKYIALKDIMGKIYIEAGALSYWLKLLLENKEGLNEIQLEWRIIRKMILKMKPSFKV